MLFVLEGQVILEIENGRARALCQAFPSTHETRNDPSELHLTHCASIGRPNSFKVKFLTAVPPYPSCRVCGEVLSKSVVIRSPQALRRDERQGHLRQRLRVQRNRDSDTQYRDALIPFD